MVRFSVSIIVFAALIACVIPCSAQEQKAEVFAGYQYLRMSTGISGMPTFGHNGWDTSFTGYFSKHFGITGDFSGSYASPSFEGVSGSSRAYSYMFGPTVRFANSSRVVPFAHALFGGAHVSGDILDMSAGSNGFAWAAGGGLDIKAGKVLSLRLAQADFVQTHIEGGTQNHFRYATGIVFRF